MANIRHIIGRNLKYIRYQSGLSQEDFYNKYNLNFKYYSMIERGELNVRVDTIERLANLLNVSYEEFFVNDPNREITATRIDARN